MWERFKPEARNIFFVAEEEVRRLRGNYISTEHLLLGILADKHCKATQLLIALGFVVDDIRNEVNRQLPGPGNIPYQPLQLTGNARRVIDTAFLEAKKRQKEEIGTEHLLVGLLENEGLAGRVLAAFGVTAEQIRQKLPPE